MKIEKEMESKIGKKKLIQKSRSVKKKEKH